MNERELQKLVVPMARRLGWRVAHFPKIQDVKGVWRTPVAGDGKGWPDLVLVRERVLVVELKSNVGRLSPDQDDWLAAFRMAGATVAVWTPRDWSMGLVESELTRCTDLSPFPEPTMHSVG